LGLKGLSPYSSEGSLSGEACSWTARGSRFGAEQQAAVRGLFDEMLEELRQAGTAHIEITFVTDLPSSSS
jgi:hypothetical protein